MQIPVSKFTDDILKWQLQTLRAFDAHLARFFVLECHRRSRKTTLILNLLIRACMRKPNSVYPYVGPTYKQAKKIVWRDPNMLFTYLPDRNKCPWEKNESELYIKFPNGSILPILGGDDPDSIRGIDGNGFGFDEWALMKEEIWTEIIRPLMTQDPNRWAVFGYTPKGANHAPRMFDKAACLGSGGILPTNGPARKMLDGWFAIRVLAEESGILPPLELARAKAETPLVFYEQEYQCARTTQEERTLITSAMLEMLKGRDWDYSMIPTVRRIIACDPAFGGNECVAKAMENCRTLKDGQRIMHYRDPAKVIGELLNMSYQFDIRNFIVDSIGNGQAIVYGLNEKSDEKRPLNIISFNSAEAAVKKSPLYRFANKRAEMWWYVMQQCYDMEVPYPEDNETRRQIPYASKYTFSRTGGRLLMLLKEKIVELCGCSPDRAECWGMGVYGTQFIEPETEKSDDYGRRKERVPDSAMVC